jgi:two-component sensor histidine kinase
LQSASITHNVDVELAGEPFTISPRLSIALGIILNELLTNAAKYGVPEDGPAAPEGPAGPRPASSGHAAAGRALSVAIRRDDEEAVELTVRDAGPGFPEALLEEGRYGFGLTIASALARQYGGSLRLRNDNGAVATVTLRE